MLDDGSFKASGEGVWVRHEDVNPATGEVEDKHFWLWSTTGWCSAPAGTTTSTVDEGMPTLGVTGNALHMMALLDLACSLGLRRLFDGGAGTSDR